MNFKKLTILTVVAVSCGTVLGAPKARKAIKTAAAATMVKKAAQPRMPQVRGARPALRAANNGRPAARAAVVGAVRRAQGRNVNARGAQRPAGQQTIGQRVTRITARPAARVAARPAARPAARGAGRGAARPVAQPMPRPAVQARPGARVAARQQPAPRAMAQQRPVARAAQPVRQAARPMAQQAQRPGMQARPMAQAQPQPRPYYNPAPAAQPRPMVNPAADDAVNYFHMNVVYKDQNQARPAAPKQNRPEQPAYAFPDLKNTVGTDGSEAADINDAQPKGPKKNCGICRDDSENMRTLHCGHEYCVDCLAHMVNLAADEKNADNLRCPEPKCRQNLDMTDVRRIIKDRARINTLNGILINQFLNGQKGVKRCPTTDCNYAFFNEDNRASNVKCPQCNHSYCAACLHPHTHGGSCDEAKARAAAGGKYDENEAANEAWKRQNTKPCPQCGKAIEKNAGCRHMKCTQCKHQFCWNCLADDYGHSPRCGCQ